MGVQATHKVDDGRRNTLLAEHKLGCVDVGPSHRVTHGAGDFVDVGLATEIPVSHVMNAGDGFRAVLLGLGQVIAKYVWQPDAVKVKKHCSDHFTSIAKAGLSRDCK